MPRGHPVDGRPRAGARHAGELAQAAARRPHPQSLRRRARRPDPALPQRRRPASHRGAGGGAEPESIALAARALAPLAAGNGEPAGKPATAELISLPERCRGTRRTAATSTTTSMPRSTRWPGRSPLTTGPNLAWPAASGRQSCRAPAASCETAARSSTPTRRMPSCHRRHDECRGCERDRSQRLAQVRCPSQGSENGCSQGSFSRPSAAYRWAMPRTTRFPPGDPQIMLVGHQEKQQSYPSLMYQPGTGKAGTPCDPSAITPTRTLQTGRITRNLRRGPGRFTAGTVRWRGPPGWRLRLGLP
jgi:hypothetical protein